VDEIDKAFLAGSLGHVGTSPALGSLLPAPFVRRRHGGQGGCWDPALSTPTAAEVCGRRPAFTELHPGSDDRPWSRSCTLPDPDRRPLDRAGAKSDHRRASRCRQKLLACALGHKACRDNRSVLYQRIPRLFGDLALARRRSLPASDARPRRRQALDPRRLGSRAARAGATPRHVGKASSTTAR
jgi:hypothetical protein